MATISVCHDQLSVRPLLLPGGIGESSCGGAERVAALTLEQQQRHWQTDDAPWSAQDAAAITARSRKHANALILVAEVFVDQVAA